MPVFLQVLVVGTLVLALLLWFLPVQVRIGLQQESWQARLQIHLRAPLVSLVWNLNISDKIAMALEHIWTRWRATGEPVKVPLQKTIRRIPHRKLRRALRQPIRYLGRRTHCRHLQIRAEVGGWDAMDSALLAGASWALVGTGVSMLSRVVHLDPAVPRVTVVPNFRQAQLRVHADCILKLRLGHAIVTGVWLLRRVLKEREIVAWVRDSWRRKGEEGDRDERTSDSGPYEDGHGVD